MILAAPEITDMIYGYADRYDISFHQRKYQAADIYYSDVIISATDLPALNQEVRKNVRAAGKLINVADKPDLCDFYLGGG